MLAVLMLNRMTMRRRNLRAKETAFKAEKKPDTQSVYCRTCLSAEDLVAIFFNPGMEKKRTDELRLVTGLEIMRNDGLSQKICSNCVEKINSALRFRKQSKKAEKSLLNMSLGLKPKKKSISKISRKTVKVKSPKVQRIKRKVKKVEELDYKSSYDDFQNDCDDMDVPLSDFNEVEEKPKIKQVKSPKMQRIKRKLKKSEELDYKCSYDDCQNDCDDMDLPLSDFNEVEEKPKIERLLKKPGVRKRLSIPNAASYKCGTCSKEFRMKATFKAHMRFHTNYCVCEACGKRCRNNNQLQEHKRARHGLGRIHKCAYCEYSSATKEALTIHERRHTGERPYICDHCGASFHRRSNLVQHIAIHLPEKNFQCDMCPKRLKSRKFLQIHKHNAHTGKRYGYLCPVCAHRFEKPNKCSLCLKREKSKKLLQVHVFKAHREKRYRYICPVCRDTFTRPGNVRQHLARSHGVPRADQPAIDRFQAHSYFSEEVPPRLYSYL